MPHETNFIDFSLIVYIFSDIYELRISFVSGCRASNRLGSQTLLHSHWVRIPLSFYRRQLWTAAYRCYRMSSRIYPLHCPWSRAVLGPGFVGNCSQYANPRSAWCHYQHPKPTHHLDSRPYNSQSPYGRRDFVRTCRLRPSIAWCYRPMRMQTYIWNRAKMSQYVVVECCRQRPEKSYTHLLGCSTTLRTLFLWFVNVHLLLPAFKSHKRTVESWLPVIICGSWDWHTTLATVFVWPTNVWMFVFVRMSHTRAVESRPADTSNPIVGCRANE